MPIGWSLVRSSAPTARVPVMFLPSVPLDVPIASSDPSEGVPDRTSLTFSETDWFVPQQVVITGQQDAIARQPAAPVVIGVVEARPRRGDGAGAIDEEMPCDTAAVGQLEVLDKAGLAAKLHVRDRAAARDHAEMQSVSPHHRPVARRIDHQAIFIA